MVGVRRNDEFFRFRLLLCDSGVQLCNKNVGIVAVYHASLLNGLASGAGAGEAMHTDLKEQRLGLGMVVEDISDYGGLGDSHIFIHSCIIIFGVNGFPFQSIITYFSLEVNRIIE